MNLTWPNSTNKGTALLKLLHQRLPDPIVKDEYLQWFVDDSNLSSRPSIGSLLRPSADPQEEFQRIAFWYVGLREKYFDELIRKSLRDGATQVLLLGSGFDTRYLRLPEVANTTIQTFEVDREATVVFKQKALLTRLGRLPQNLHLIAFDFNIEKLDGLLHRGIDTQRPTVCVWQGVSYYLSEETVGRVLGFIYSRFPRLTSFGFDSCTPLMLEENDEVPGIRFNIERLNAIGEPYVFGRFPDAMEQWLKEIGFSGVHYREQPELEKMYRPGIRLPRNMWYVVTAMSCRNSAL